MVEELVSRVVTELVSVLDADDEEPLLATELLDELDTVETVETVVELVAELDGEASEVVDGVSVLDEEVVVLLVVILSVVLSFVLEDEDVVVVVMTSPGFGQAPGL